MTDNIYAVRVAKYAWIYVAAPDESEIESIVDQSYIEDSIFDDADVEYEGHDNCCYIEDCEGDDDIYYRDDMGECQVCVASEYESMLDAAIGIDGEDDIVKRMKRKAVYSNDELMKFPE